MKVRNSGRYVSSLGTYRLGSIFSTPALLQCRFHANATPKRHPRHPKAITMLSSFPRQAKASAQRRVVDHVRIRRSVASWVMWDVGSLSFDSIMTTFIFTVYLTSSYFRYARRDLFGAITGSDHCRFPSDSSAGDRPAQRQVRQGIFWLGVNTMLLVGSMAVLLRGPHPQYLWLGVALISAASVFSEFAYVNYNAVPPRISHPENIGKIFGRRMGCRLHWRHPGVGCGAVGVCAYPRGTSA